MSAQSKWFLVCYDIRDDKRLRKVAKLIEGYGTRMQYSVFRCWLDPIEKNKLHWQLTELVELEDDVMFIPLCENCVSGMCVTHSSQKQPDWPDRPKTHLVI